MFVAVVVVAVNVAVFVAVAKGICVVVTCCRSCWFVLTHYCNFY